MVCQSSAGNAICLIIAQIMVHLIKHEWPQQWPSMVAELISLGQAGYLQARAVFDIFRRLSEDILLFQDVPTKRRRELSCALSENLNLITNFALDCIYSAVKLHSFQHVDFDEDTTRCLCSALFLLSALYEWCHLFPLFEWKPSDQISSTPCVSPFIRLSLFLIRIPKLRAATAGFLTVILAKKQAFVNAGGDKTFDTIPVYRQFFAFNEENPVEQIFEISSSAFSISEFEETTCTFMRRWADAISRLGILVIEDWKNFEATGAQSLQAFDLLIQANILALCHPSSLFINQACSFLKAILSSTHSTLVSLLVKYMPTLLTTWMECMIMQPFPSSNDPLAPWILVKYEKDYYSTKLAERRAYVKRNCLFYAASLWPTEVLGCLIDWHKRVLSLIPEPSDVILSGCPFVKPTASLVRQWEGLSFAMEKTAATAYSGATDVVVYQSPDRTAARNTLLAHLRECFNFISDLPSDPGIRQYYLSVLHTLIMACSETGHEFILKLLTMEFASLRYNPQVSPSAGQSVSVPSQMLKYINLRCAAVRDLHTSIGVNIFRLVRGQATVMLPYFDSFCSELNNIWTNRYGGMAEHCVLLEVVIYLALRLPCSFAEQRDKLSSILNGVLSEWYNADGFLVAFGAEEGGLIRFLEYYGFTQDAEVMKKNVDFLTEREITRLQLQWSTSATGSILKRLCDTLSLEQVFAQALAAGDTSEMPPFHAFTIRGVTSVVNEAVSDASVADSATRSQCYWRIDARHHDGSIGEILVTLAQRLGQSLVKVDYQELSKVYLSKLHSHIAQLYVTSLDICKSILAISSSRIYAMPTEELANLLCTYLCPNLLDMPDFQLLQLLRNMIIPYVEFCPTKHIENALVPLMPYVLDALFQKVNKSWAAVKIIDRDEVGEEEAMEEIFAEETVRALSAKVLDLTRKLMWLR
ncbi:hypothetical protein Aperf_G00000129333 [Anoplocephala perfoliata]